MLKIPTKLPSSVIHEETIPLDWSGLALTGVMPDRHTSFRPTGIRNQESPLGTELLPCIHMRLQYARD